MSEPALLFLHYVFLIFHTLFTLFNLFAWIPRRTRRLHLYSMGATLFSWVVLGYWYGWGYCFCTDWHWRVLRRLGESPQERSYIQYLIRELSGLTPPEAITIAVTQWVFIALVVVTIVVNLPVRRR